MVPFRTQLPDDILCKRSEEHILNWNQVRAWYIYLLYNNYKIIKITQRSPIYRCLQCDLLHRYCFCDKLPKSKYLKELSLEIFENIFVYTHYKELCNQRSSNTGKWLIYSGAKLVVYGKRDEEYHMFKILKQLPSYTTAILYPHTSNSISPSDLMQKYIKVKYNNTFKPTLIILDATWNLAKSLQRRLEQLSLLYINAPINTYCSYISLSKSIYTEFGTFRRKFTHIHTVSTDKISTIHAFCTFIHEAFPEDDNAKIFNENLFNILQAALIGYHSQTDCRKNELVSSSIQDIIHRV